MSSVLITGSGCGIGRATALELARRGHHVIATARDPRHLQDLPVAARLQLDVTDPRSVEQAVAAAGAIDVLISNAGVIFLAPIETTPPDELERLLRQNTVGALRVAQAVLPQCASGAAAECCSSPASWDASRFRRAAPTPPPSGRSRRW